MYKESTYTKADHRARKKKSLLDKKKSYTSGSIKHDHPGYTRDTYVTTLSGSHQGTVAAIDVIKEGKQFSVWDKVAQATVQLRLDSSLPKPLGKDILIGDTVSYRREEESGYLVQRLPRINTLSRLKAERDGASGPRNKKLGIVANIDIGIIVAAAINPAFHANFVDRYAILLQYSDIRPLICITKSDLKTIEDPILDRYQTQLGIDVIYCSVKTGQGIDTLKANIAGKTTVLLGNSGVGKSSLTNTLLGEEHRRTGEVSSKSGQGKHTTTSSQLYQWQPDSYIIDTPGIRSLELLEIKKDQLKDYFPDFIAYASQCQYRDCTHTHEPKCAIKDAVKDNKITQPRYDNYLRILAKLG